MRPLLIIALVTLGIRCVSNKATIPVDETVENQLPDSDLSDYIMVCFSNKYLQENEITVPKNAFIYSTKNNERTCVNKKDYITRHLIDKAYYGDETSIDLIIKIHKSLKRSDHIHSPNFENKIRGQKLFDNYYERFTTEPCQETSSDCSSNYVAWRDFYHLMKTVDNINGQSPTEYLDKNAKWDISLSSSIEYCSDLDYQIHMKVLIPLN